MGKWNHTTVEQEIPRYAPVFKSFFSFFLLMLLWLPSCGTQVGPIQYSLQFTATSSSALEVGIIVFCPCRPIDFCFLISEVLRASWLCLPTHCLHYLGKEMAYKKFTPANFSFFHKMEKIDLIKIKQVRLGRRLTGWRTGRKSMVMCSASQPHRKD